MRDQWGSASLTLTSSPSPLSTRSGARARADVQVGTVFYYYLLRISPVKLFRSKLLVVVGQAWQ